jgi:Ca2+-binding RTX toxin-like protein
MPLSVFGQASVLPGFTGNVGTQFHFAALPDGRFVISGPTNVASESVFLHAADGTLLRGLALTSIGGLPGLNGALGIATMPDGRFIVSGLIQGTLEIGYVIFAPDGTPVGYDDGGVTRFTRPVFDIEFFGGGFQAAHKVAALPDGRLVFAWNSVKDQVAGPVGNTGGLDILGSGGGGSTSVDIRAVFVAADGTVGPETIVTQGQVDFPTYVIESRFGLQNLKDLDILPDGSIVLSYVGDRFALPGSFFGQPVSDRFPYANLRVLDDDGTPLVGETPFSDGIIGAATADSFGNGAQVAQTIQLADGRLAGFFGRFIPGTSIYEISVRFFTGAGVAIGEAETLDFTIDRTFGRDIVLAALPTADGGFVVLHNGDDGLPQPLRNEAQLYLARYNTDAALVERIRVTDTPALWEIRSFEIGPDGDFVAAVTPNSSGLQILRLVASTTGDVVDSGTAGDDTVPLGAGNDWYDGLAGADTVAGGEGDDRLYGNAGNDRLDGGNGNDLLGGGAGDDTLLGGAGADTLRGDTGADSLAGGAGNDAYVVDDAADRILETRTGGADTVYSSVSWTLGAHLEALVLTGDAAINGTGNNLANVITGNDAANVLNGGGRADTLIGGGGNDLYLVDATDILIEEADGGYDTVILNATFALPDHIEELRFNGTANARGDGNAGDNLIRGNAGNNRLLGHDGNDTLNGGLGDDILFGGNGADSLVGSDGADTMVGGAGNDIYLIDALDRVIEAANEGIDTILTAVSYTLPAHFETLILLGSGDLTGTGNGLDNVLIGNSGANLLRGLGGADSIAGSQGADTLEGGLGADTLTGSGGFDLFLWLSPAEGGDVVTDFRPGDDRLAFTGAAFGGLAPGPLDAAHFAEDAPSAAVAQFVYAKSTGLLEWDADGSGAGAAVFVATLSNKPALTAGDVLIV